MTTGSVHTQVSRLLTASATVAVVLLAAACSSPDEKARKTYMAACDHALGREDVCSCTYDTLREKHSPQEIADASLNPEMPAPSFVKDMAQASVICLGNAGLIPRSLAPGPN